VSANQLSLVKTQRCELAKETITYISTAAVEIAFRLTLNDFNVEYTSTIIASFRLLPKDSKLSAGVGSGVSREI
jgi:hypothetical protein